MANKGRCTAGIAANRLACSVNTRTVCTRGTRLRDASALSNTRSNITAGTATLSIAARNGGILNARGQSMTSAIVVPADTDKGTCNPVTHKTGGTRPAYTGTHGISTSNSWRQRTAAIVELTFILVVTSKPIPGVTGGTRAAVKTSRQVYTRYRRTGGTRRSGTRSALINVHRARRTLTAPTGRPALVTKAPVFGGIWLIPWQVDTSAMPAQRLVRAAVTVVVLLGTVNSVPVGCTLAAITARRVHTGRPVLTAQVGAVVTGTLVHVRLTGGPLPGRRAAT